MLEQRRRRMTPYEPSTPTHPKGYNVVGALASLFACGSGSRASALDRSLLPDAHRHRVVAPPCIHPHGVRNETRWGSSATC